MAEQKLHMSILRQAIVDRTGATEKEAGLFLKVLVEQIIEGLKAGEQIKINGLGTFRLQEMAPRKSVNVNTGEAMVIPGYKKVVFMPEVSMREMVEKNGTVVALSGLNERPSAPVANEESLSPLEKLGRQADEIVDLLADLGQGPKAVVPAAEEREETVAETTANEPEVIPTKEATEEEEITETPADETENEITEDDVKGEDVAEKEEKTEEKGEDAAREEEEIKEEETPEETKEEQEIAAEEVQEGKEEEEPQEEQKEQEKQEKKKRKYHFLRDTLICVVCLLAVLLGGFFCMRNALSNWIDTLVTERKQPAADTIVQEVKAPVAVEEKTAEPAAPTMQETRAERPVYKSYIATEEIREGSRLTWLAYRYYGDKALWVYIYDANKDHLGNPNNIKVGTPIRIPALTAAQRDTTLTSTRETMQMLLDEAVNWDKQKQ